jgi:hypothetical protein
MDAKEITDKICYIDFVQSVRTGDHPEIRLLGSGTVTDVIIKDGVIFIAGEDLGVDEYAKGYRQAIADIQDQLKDRVIKKIEEDMFKKDDPAYDFKRDYHGEFKKKEG